MCQVVETEDWVLVVYTRDYDPFSFDDADTWQVMDDGILNIYQENEIVATYRPGFWDGVVWMRLEDLEAEDG